MDPWIGAGLADWWCHRRTDIEHTAGTRESAIHAAMMLEGGLPAMLGLFCEVNAGVLAITYATHGFLECVPLMAAAFLTVLHWDQAQSMVGKGGTPDWRIKRKRRRLSGRYRAGVLTAVVVLVAVPYGEELSRCLRAGSSSHEPVSAEDDLAD